MIKPGNGKENYERALELVDREKTFHEEKNDSNDYTQPLVSIQRRVKRDLINLIFLKRERTFADKIKECFGFYDENVERIIYLNGKPAPQKPIPNVVKNQKYNILTFIPLVLYNQFKFFFNFFYLMITVSQFFEPLKVGK